VFVNLFHGINAVAKHQLSFYFVDPSPEIQQLINDDQLGFEVPANFIDHPRYIPTDQERAFMADVPSLIFDIIHHVLPEHPTLDPLTPFYYLKTGQLPMFVVKWFIDAQKPSRLSNMTLFYRAMHCIELTRGYTHDVVDEVDLMDEEEEEEESRTEPPAQSQIAEGQAR